MKAIEFKPIDELKEFKKFGDSFVQVEKFDNNIYLYKRTFGPDNKYWCYELVKGVKHKNPNGQVIYVYPSTSSWGHSGFSLYSGTSREKIQSLVDRLKTTK